MERSIAIIALCDFLACSLAVLPPNEHWVYLGTSLENLRYRVSLELSSLTGISPKGGWASGVLEIRTRQPDFPLKMAESFLDESIKLHLAEESLTIALEELEDKI